MTFGKVIGGGLPVGAFGGRADIMALLAPIGPVYQAGTLSGNPIATAAGLATLHGCDAAVYAHLDETARTVGDLVSAALAGAGVPHRLQRAGNLFSVFFADDEVTQLRRRPAAVHRGICRVLPRRCWTPGSICRRRRSRPGSSPQLTIPGRWTGYRRHYRVRRRRQLQRQAPDDAGSPGSGSGCTAIGQQ